MCVLPGLLGGEGDEEGRVGGLEGWLIAKWGARLGRCRVSSRILNAAAIIYLCLACFSYHFLSFQAQPIASRSVRFLTPLPSLAPPPP